MTIGTILTGTVLHRRLRPKAHHLTYRIFSLLLDLDRLDATAKRLRFLSVDRFNLLSFWPRDHGDGSPAPLRAQAEALLARAGIARPDRIELLAMPRLFGFAFNPLSLWFCYSPRDRLSAVIYEVHNTFGERHFYVAPASGETVERHYAAKSFHVSPFLPMDLDYRFRLRMLDDQMTLGIEVRDSVGPKLVAVQKMIGRPLTDGAILRTALAMPFMTFKVVAGILFEAARLWWKGVPVYRHPRNHRARVTLASNRDRLKRVKAA